VHNVGDVVDVDVVTLAEMEEQGVVENLESTDVTRIGPGPGAPTPDEPAPAEPKPTQPSAPKDDSK
jgi:hypothetical protein